MPMNADAIQAGLTLERADGLRIGRERIALIEAILTQGSISSAARSLDISYRNAWDSVRAMNNLFEAPLVATQAGGSAGGAAQVTPRGMAVVTAFRRVERELSEVLDVFQRGLTGAEALWSLGMRTSARNALRGVVKSVSEGAVSSEVLLDIAPGFEIAATITRQSVEALGLAPGVAAIALIKSNFVILAKSDGAALRTSARNQIEGTVASREDGAVNTEIELAITGGKAITATVTRESAEVLDLKVGDAVVALIKAPHVILAVE